LKNAKTFIESRSIGNSKPLEPGSSLLPDPKISHKNGAVKNEETGSDYAECPANALAIK
jgi:hypothetical protein